MAAMDAPDAKLHFGALGVLLGWVFEGVMGV